MENSNLTCGTSIGGRPHLINIGLLNSDLNSGNMGCNALGYSAIMLLEEASKMIGISSKYTIFNNISDSAVALYDNLLNTQIQIIAPGLTFRSKIDNILQKKAGYIKYIKHFYRGFDSCDIFFEISGGDSFSDIYGLYRPRTTRKYHALVSKKRKPLVFLPQTIGPFETDEAKKIASVSLSYACRIFARDPISYNNAMNFTTSNKITQTIDMACFMDFTPREKSTDKLRIGINPSGLLWNGGYTGNNQFQLKTDYKKLMACIIESIDNEKYDIILVPHVLHGPKHDIEDDYIVCRWLKQKYQFCEIAPFFYTPVEAKSFISGLDLLVGSRMHACIAAYSSGVPIYPLAYSRKFRGLFKKELDYPHGAELVSDDIYAVIEGLQNVLDNLLDIQAEMLCRLERLLNYKHVLVDELKNILLSMVNVGK